MRPLQPIIRKASNVRGGSNPRYGLNDFLKIYPQFGKDSDGNEIVPHEVIKQYIGFAHSSLSYSRWLDTWRQGMGLFIAHWCTLWLMTLADPDDGKAAVAAAGQRKGIMSAKAVDGVSASYDLSVGGQGLERWGGWNQTEFGKQLVTLARLVGAGGMYIW